MAKKSLKTVKEALAADKSAKWSAAVKPVDKPVQSEPVATETQAVNASAIAPAQEPQHLLTPLAALWPTATLPEPTKSPETAVKPTAPKTVQVTFVLFEPCAKQVFLSGEFNGWAPNATPMKRQADGHWETTIALATGRYEYKFVADGLWIPDPLAHENVWNQHGTLNSVAQVRP